MHYRAYGNGDQTTRRLSDLNTYLAALLPAFLSIYNVKITIN